MINDKDISKIETAIEKDQYKRALKLYFKQPDILRIIQLEKLRGKLILKTIKENDQKNFLIVLGDQIQKREFESDSNLTVESTKEYLSLCDNKNYKLTENDIDELFGDDEIGNYFKESLNQKPYFPFTWEEPLKIFLQNTYSKIKITREQKALYIKVSNRINGNTKSEQEQAKPGQTIEEPILLKPKLEEKESEIKQETPPLIACANCGNKLNPSAKFCTECGTKVESKCPGCGTAYAAGSKFCTECGTKLENN